MKTKSNSGFTLVEVIIAIVVLTVGLLGLASTAAVVTRMIGQGQRYSEAAAIASERFEILRAQSCPSMAAGSETKDQFSLRWTVSSVNGTKGNLLSVYVTSPTGTGTRVDSFVTAVACN